MTPIPATSITLLKAISDSADSMRWTEFYSRYSEPMHGFMERHYPSVDADDAIQDTMVALIKALPDYRQPTDDSRPHFRNYLFGVLRHKAIDLVRRGTKQNNLRDQLEHENDSGLRMGVSAGADSVDGYGRMRPPEEYGPDDDDEWRKSIMEVAIAQLMSDESIQPTTRQVFRHVAILNEPPESVARQFGLTRNNVDQIKKRLIVRLSKMISALTAT